MDDMSASTRPRKDHLDALAVGILLVCCMFWGFQQVLVKATVAELPPVFQSAVRGIGATLLLWLWCQWRRVRLFERDGSLWAGLLVGCLFAAEFAFIYIGLQHTTASRLTVFLYTSPFWVAALLPLFIRTERLRPARRFWRRRCHGRPDGPGRRRLVGLDYGGHSGGQPHAAGR
jgi:drug/metabolite transporter (DMT)-like permease